MHTEPIAAARSRDDLDRARAAEPAPPRSRTRRPRAPKQLARARFARDSDRPLQRRTIKERLKTQALKERLAPSRLAVLLNFVDCWQPDRPLYPRIAEYIAPESNVSASTAYECLADLREAGILVWQQRRDDHGHNRSSLYWFTPEFFERAGVPPIAPPYSDFDPLPPPKFRHKRDPSSISDLSGSSGSIDPCTNGMEQRAREASRPPVFRSNEDPAVADLLQATAEAHAERYRRSFEERGLKYGPHVAGTIAPEHLAAMALELRNLAARANEYARTRNRFDLTDDGIRVKMTWKLARYFIAQNRPYLLERNHPRGCLWGRGGADGTPCDFVVLAAQVFEEFCAALDDGEPAPLVVPPPEPYEPPTDDLDEAREACEELRARAASTPLDEPPHAPELDDIEPDPHAGEPSPEHVRRVAAPHVESDEARAARLELRAAVASLTTSATDTAPTTREPARIDPPTRDTAIGGRSLVAALAEGPSDDAPPPRTRARAACAFGVDLDALKARDERAQQQAYLARIGEIARREALAKARAERAKHPRGGRAHLPTQPHPRAALLAALASLVDPSKGPPTASTTRTTPPPFEGPATPRDEDERAPPLLRDVRPRGEERAPLRRPAPPRRRT